MISYKRTQLNIPGIFPPKIVRFKWRVLSWSAIPLAQRFPILLGFERLTETNNTNTLTTNNADLLTLSHKDKVYIGMWYFTETPRSNQASCSLHSSNVPASLTCGPVRAACFFKSLQPIRERLAWMDQWEPSISDRTPCRQGTKPNYVHHGIKSVVIDLRYQFKYSHKVSEI